jgi:hypothetical protein
LVDEPTKQDLIRSARSHGDFRDAESAINRSGKSLDWDQRVFGFELKGTEGDSTHALIVLLDADTEEGLDDAMVSVYFKKRALVGYEVKSVLVTQILQRDGEKLVEGATADLVSGTGAWIVAEPNASKPQAFLAGKISGRRTLEQLATIEPAAPPVDYMTIRRHPIPPCENSPGSLSLQEEYDEYKIVWKNHQTAETNVRNSGDTDLRNAQISFALTAAGYPSTVDALLTCAFGPNPVCAGAAAIHGVTGLALVLSQFWFWDALEERDRQRALLNDALRDYMDEWERQDCGNFPLLP